MKLFLPKIESLNTLRECDSSSKGRGKIAKENMLRITPPLSCEFSHNKNKGDMQKRIDYTAHRQKIIETRYSDDYMAVLFLLKEV